VIGLDNDWPTALVMFGAFLFGVFYGWLRWKPR
jgi:hypothetical protein